MATYQARCGVCGREYDEEASFLSVPFSYADGRIRLNCTNELRHTREEVVEAWEREGRPMGGALPAALS